MKVVFLGDSITDAERNRNNLAANRCDALGNGYVGRVAGNLILQNTGCQCWNFGLNGLRIQDLVQKPPEWLTRYNPGLISLMIGINDIWHPRINQQPCDPASSVALLLPWLEQIQRTMPDTQIIMMEPFALLTGIVQPDWSDDLTNLQSALANIAEQRGIRFILLQSVINQVAQQLGDKQVLYDGVHPTPAGHELIAREWLAQVQLP